MNRKKLDIESLAVETFSTAPEAAQLDAEFLGPVISRRSCIEQCTTSCTEMA